jgi:HEAT repeat protein
MAHGWTLFCARARILLVAAGLLTVAWAVPVAADDQVAESIKALRSPDPQARTQAQDKLVKAGASAVPEIVAHLSDQRRRLPLYAVLGRMGKPVMPQLMELLKDPNVRPQAGEALFQLMRPEYGQGRALLKCLPDPDLKHYCGPALVKAVDAKSQGLVADLSRKVKSRDQDVRMYAATTLGQIGPQAGEAAPDLALALKDPEAPVRLAAARALGKIGPRAGKARPALEAAAKDKDPQMSREAAKALKWLPQALKKAPQAPGKSRR